eukprot:TRINITY_DN21926_c0_g1_i3.p1 TRINITY_DN21926_c0_g1~~TRINITY_DN21926_c0_g1_i3.p1  ORF type:complete len:185 (+),score=24.02 TRINITY_DN21926_c0_g1_i3:77-631(+)
MAGDSRWSVVSGCTIAWAWLVGCLVGGWRVIHSEKGEPGICSIKTMDYDFMCRNYGTWQAPEVQNANITLDGSGDVVACRPLLLSGRCKETSRKVEGLTLPETLVDCVVLASGKCKSRSFNKDSKGIGVMVILAGFFGWCTCLSSAVGVREEDDANTGMYMLRAVTRRASKVAEVDSDDEGLVS